MPTGLVARAFERAVRGGQPAGGLLHHSDRGSQYASDAYRELLRRHEVVPSMSRPANCYDNARLESLWATLKTELIGTHVFASHAEAKTAIFDYIEVFYNRRRLHRALGYQSCVGSDPDHAATDFTRSRQRMRNEGTPRRCLRAWAIGPARTTGSRGARDHLPTGVGGRCGRKVTHRDRVQTGVDLLEYPWLCHGVQEKTMHTLWMGIYHAGIMGWETLWALVLGFGISAALQVFVDKAQMSRLFGQTSLKSVALAMGFGAASSSCSYAAAAAARSAFRQGAALIPALAFMFASTNLVVELGAVLWLLLGWRFVLAETVGAFVLVALLWTLARLVLPADLERQARAHVDHDDDEAEGCCHHGDGEGGRAPDHPSRPDGGDEADPWGRLAEAFVMDWQMLWKEITVGFLVAGYLMALVPMDGWKVLFLQGGPGWLRLVENAAVGPLIAVASFVCSVGNIPLASVLWSGGISFGGVISFVYADLLIVPLIFVYRKYYGARAAFYFCAIFYAAMVGAGIIVDLLFNALHLIPTGPRPSSIVEQAHFSWNYTTWLDLLALGAGGLLLWRHFYRSSVGPSPGDHPAPAVTPSHESGAH